MNSNDENNNYKKLSLMFKDKNLKYKNIYDIKLNKYPQDRLDY